MVDILADCIAGVVKGKSSKRDTGVKSGTNKKKYMA